MDLKAISQPGNGKFHFWSIQSLGAWQSLQKEGRLRTDGRMVSRDFKSAYRWLMDQMCSRLPEYSGGYPVWAWVHPKPDLRSTAHLPSGTRGVRIELCVPTSRVLPLDFGAWHAVLNGFYLALTEKEDRAWEKRLPKGKFRYDELPADLRKEMERSWERVFDLKVLDQSRWIGPVQSIQAVLEEIRLDEVMRVKRFIAR